jgi:SAM-dependent methyltransferase
MVDGLAHEGLPQVPPERLQQKFNASVGARNLEAGYGYYRWIRDAAARFGVPITSSTRIAEFGCGWGRVLRCFLHDVPASQLTGFDVLPLAVQAAGNVVPGARIALNDTSPPTIFADDSFDLLYAVSVFSHLPEPLHREWLAEIARVLRPGGVAVLSTLPRATVVKLAAFGPDAVARYDAGEFVFEPHPTETYGLAAIPESYVRRVWPQWLTVREFRPEGLAQAEVIATAP